MNINIRMEGKTHAIEQEGGSEGQGTLMEGRGQW